MDNYVVLVPQRSEQFLDKEQTLLWLQSWLNKFDSLPLDLECKSSIAEAAQHLLDTACDLEIKTGLQFSGIPFGLSLRVNEDAW